MSDNIWYYVDYSAIKPIQIGPRSKEQLKELWEKGEIDECTYVCGQNEKKWLPIKDSQLKDYFGGLVSLGNRFASARHSILLSANINIDSKINDDDDDENDINVDDENNDDKYSEEMKVIVEITNDLANYQVAIQNCQKIVALLSKLTKFISKNNHLNLTIYPLLFHHLTCIYIKSSRLASSNRQANYLNEFVVRTMCLISSMNPSEYAPILAQSNSLLAEKSNPSIHKRMSVSADLNLCNALCRTLDLNILEKASKEQISLNRQKFQPRIMLLSLLLLYCDADQLNMRENSTAEAVKKVIKCLRRCRIPHFDAKKSDLVKLSSRVLICLNQILITYSANSKDGLIYSVETVLPSLEVALLNDIKDVELFDAIIDDDTLDNNVVNFNENDVTWEQRLIRGILVLLEQYFGINDQHNDTHYLILPQAVSIVKDIVEEICRMIQTLPLENSMSIRLLKVIVQMLNHWPLEKWNIIDPNNELQNKLRINVERQVYSVMNIKDLNYQQIVTLLLDEIMNPPTKTIRKRKESIDLPPAPPSSSYSTSQNNSTTTNSISNSQNNNNNNDSNKMRQDSIALPPPPPSSSSSNKSNKNAVSSDNNNNNNNKSRPPPPPVVKKKLKLPPKLMIKPIEIEIDGESIDLPPPPPPDIDVIEFIPSPPDTPPPPPPQDDSLLDLKSDNREIPDNNIVKNENESIDNDNYNDDDDEDDDEEEEDDNNEDANLEEDNDKVVNEGANIDDKVKPNIKEENNNQIKEDEMIGELEFETGNEELFEMILIEETNIDDEGDDDNMENEEIIEENIMNDVEDNNSSNNIENIIVEKETYHLVIEELLNTILNDNEIIEEVDVQSGDLLEVINELYDIFHDDDGISYYGLLDFYNALEKVYSKYKAASINHNLANTPAYRYAAFRKRWSTHETTGKFMNQNEFKNMIMSHVIKLMNIEDIEVNILIRSILDFIETLQNDKEALKLERQELLRLSQKVLTSKESDIVIAIYDFVGGVRQDEELIMKAGDYIRILRRDDESTGWTYGMHIKTGGGRGWFPTTYIQQILSSKLNNNESPKRKKKKRKKKKKRANYKNQMLKNQMYTIMAGASDNNLVFSKANALINESKDKGVTFRGINPLVQMKSEAAVSAAQADPRILFEGMYMKKHGKYLNRARFICCTRTHIFWNKNAAESYKVRKASKRNKKYLKEAIAFKDVKRVTLGKTTSVFSKKVNERLCFSVVTDSQSLDLETPTPADAAHWVSALQRWINGLHYI